MAIGPGTFTEIAERIVQDENAAAAMVFVGGGARGSGFAVAVKHNDPAINAKVLRMLAIEVRKFANKLEQDANTFDSIDSNIGS